MYSIRTVTWRVYSPADVTMSAQHNWHQVSLMNKTTEFIMSDVIKHVMPMIKGDLAKKSWIKYQEICGRHVGVNFSLLFLKFHIFPGFYGKIFLTCSFGVTWCCLLPIMWHAEDSFNILRIEVTDGGICDSVRGSGHIQRKTLTNWG